ncbi:hypothetical protein TWF506_002528 [Arthrobotrys conoides]|uniref:Uncharacterized protein n=1 Tax=Arthrobotrys conoides TaxID=74498 RepID=A0AAN8RLX9_9PEZI
MEYYSSGQGQGGYNGQRQPQMYSSQSSNGQQYYQGQYNNQYSPQQQNNNRPQRNASQQVDYNGQYASQQQGGYDQQYDYQQAYGSQQGFQVGSSTQAAGPASQASDNQQSGHHKKKKGTKDSVRMVLETYWECHMCGNAWNCELYDMCQSPECRGHRRCNRCTVFQQERYPVKCK